MIRNIVDYEINNGTNLFIKLTKQWCIFWYCIQLEEGYSQISCEFSMRPPPVRELSSSKRGRLFSKAVWKKKPTICFQPRHKATLSIKRRLSDACGVVAPNVRRPSIRTDLMIMRTKTCSLAAGNENNAPGSRITLRTTDARKTCTIQWYLSRGILLVWMNPRKSSDGSRDFKDDPRRWTPIPSCDETLTVKENSFFLSFFNTRSFITRMKPEYWERRGEEIKKCSRFIRGNVTQGGPEFVVQASSEWFYVKK